MMSQHSSVQRFSRLFVSVLLAAGLLAGLLVLTSRVWAQPSVPPEEIHPARNVVTATLTTTVSVTYDEPISETTVTSHTFAVHGMQSGLVTGTHGVVDGNTIVVTPTRPFHQGELVYAIATTRTLNVTGTGPVSGTQWQFNVGQVISRCVAGFVTDTVASANLTNVYRGSVAWGDYDSDGDLDILLTGYDGGVVAYVYENQAGVFVTDTAASANLTGVYNSSAAWGDYDNDADLDILLTGWDGGSDPVAYVYENRAGAFITDTAASANLAGVYNSSAAWGDYDNDADLDILLTGLDGGSDPVAYVYENRAGVFITDTAASANLAGVSSSSVNWGDYDNDGDLDILLTGVDSGVSPVAYVYEYTNTTFITDTLASANLTNVFRGSVAWGDYDNDGDLDILLTGDDNSSGGVAYVYENQAGIFVTDTLASANLIGVHSSSVAWGDYDDDSDLDILLAGRAGVAGSYNTQVYRNDDCPPPDLTVVKYAAPEPVVAGESLTYTILITNQDSSTATGITVSDTLPTSVTLQTLDQTDDSEGEFNAGTHDNTHWYDPRPGYDYNDEWLEIDDTLQATGVFTSRPFDARNVVTWTHLAWRPRRPTWKPLPDNGATEEDYVFGEATMIGNRLLLHMDSLAGSTITDTSGLGNHGACPATISETCPTASADGRFNGALAFTGAASQTVVVADAHDPARYAVELWVYPTVVTDTAFILRTDTPTGTAENYSHLLGIVDGRFQHTVYDGAYRTITSTTPVTPNMWHHVVGTAESNGDIKLFVNGAQEAKLDGVGALWTGGDWYRLGSTYGPTGTTRYFTGRLDEVAVYSRTLSSGEVLDHYLRGALRMSFEVRACDDATCSGESWGGPYSEQSNTSVGLPSVAFSPILTDSRYFQYRVTLETDDADHSPELRWVRVRPDHRAVYASQGSCDADAGAFACAIGNLSAGDVVTVEAHVDVHPSALGVITNGAAISATNDVTAANNTASVTSTVRSEVGLSIHKYDDDDYDHDGYDEWDHGMADPVNPGSPMTYTLQAHNGGPSTAWDVVITDTLPIPVTGVSAQGDWASCDFYNRAITCTAASLGRYTRRHLIVTGTAPAAEGWITNTAWITAQASSVYTTSHVSDTETTLIVPLADLAIVKAADPDPVDPGETLTFTVAVTNVGPSPATDVIVTDTLQAGLVAHAIEGDWTCNEVGNVVECELAALASGASDSFQITTTVPVSGLVGNVAVVASATYDPDEDNNTAYAYAGVRPVADLHITKTDALDPVDAGAPLTYTLVVSNAGYVDAGARETHLALTNDHDVHIPWGGRARPYPSSVYLSSVEGTVRDITVTLEGLHHTYPGDLEVLLVGPGGRSAVLMANAGGGADVDATLTFHDTGERMPLSGTLTSTVVYRPTNHGLTGDLPQPAPAGPYGGSLSAFNSTSPNGWWRLYVYDTFGSDGGDIAGGWGLTLTTRTTDTVTLSDPLPAGLTGVGVDAPAGWRHVGSHPLIYEADTLPVHTQAVFTITATAPITGGVITNTAAITSTTADFWPASNEDTITTTVLAEADLGIVKAVEPVDRVGAGAPLTYTLTVTNQGPSPVVGSVVVTDRLPAALGTVVPSGAGWACDLSAAPLVTCTLGGGLAVSGTSDLVLAATAPVTPGLVLTNVAGVGAAVSDPITVNNSSLVTVTVAPQADLEVVKTVEPSVVQPNQHLTYTVAVTNHGPLDTTAVTVTDVVTGSAGLNVYDTTSGWSCVEADPVITCTHPGTFTSGEEATIWLTGTAPSGSPLPSSHIVVTNTAWVRSGLDDLQPADNTSAITVAVTLPPIAIAGIDEVVFVDEVVVLSGASSFDPDGNEPLTYAWTQTGGSAVSLSGAGSQTPHFTAPGTPTVLSFTLWVTDSLGMGCDQPDTVTITVTDRTVAGLTASNDSPTEVGQPVNFTAAITQGTNVSYTWDFGDGHTGTGSAPAHTYAMTGTYTAIVTAANTVNSLTATTEVSITPPITSHIYLPLVANNYAVAPDLVVDRLVATADAVTVTISNQGDAPVEALFENEFWVDVYIDPDPAPTGVNQTWAHLGSQGLLWGVTQDALPLDPGETLVLTTSRGHDGAYFWPGESVITWTLPVGTELWAQVDSAHEETDYGAVLENHEIVGTPYAEGGNILGPAYSTGSGAGSASPAAPDRRRRRPPLEHHLPPRP
jgi:uncharacterized repeat protein (TIGR01451 family)